MAKFDGFVLAEVFVAQAYVFTFLIIDERKVFGEREGAVAPVSVVIGDNSQPFSISHTRY